jgi:putative redox protein
MAKTVNVKWIKERQFIGVDDTDHAIVMSSQDESNNIGMNPSQLLLIALGGCTSYDVVSILEKKRQTLTSLEVTVTGEQDPDPPWTYRKIHIHFELKGPNLNPKAVQDAIVLSEKKYCSVAATIRGAVDITSDYHITDDKGEIE